MVTVSLYFQLEKGVLGNVEFEEIQEVIQAEKLRKKESL
jgi:hypothetical protein